MASPASSGRGSTAKAARGSGVRLAGLGLIGFVAGSSLGWLWGLLQRPPQPLGETPIPSSAEAVSTAKPLDQPAAAPLDPPPAVVQAVVQAVSDTDAAQGVRQAAALAKAKLAASLSKLPAGTPVPDADGA